MLCIGKPSRETIADFLDEQQTKTFSYPNIKRTQDWSVRKENLEKDESLKMYDIDESSFELGKGEDVFNKAVEGLRSWKQFDMTWVQLSFADTPIAGPCFIHLLLHS